jgi:hypothetical protein
LCEKLAIQEPETNVNDSIYYRIFCHQDLAGYLDGDKVVCYRLKEIIESFARGGYPSIIKSVAGKNKGWLRTPYQGNHFYLWWCHGGAKPVKHLSEGLESGELESGESESGESECRSHNIFLREIRHHDNHHELDAGEIYNYMEIDTRVPQDDHKPESWSELLLNKYYTQFNRDFVCCVPTSYQNRGNYRIFCHEDFICWSHGDLSLFDGYSVLSGRCRLIMQQLMAHGRTGITKGAIGVNRGWRLTPLENNKFQVWWTTIKASPLQTLQQNFTFDSRSIYLRTIRHRYDHKPISADIEDKYIEIMPIDLKYSDGCGTDPWTEEQQSFIDSSANFRAVIGSPGTGKTTVLYHAILERNDRHVLYLTWSKRMAELVKEFFVQTKINIEVYAFDDFIRELGNSFDCNLTLLPKLPPEKIAISPFLQWARTYLSHKWQIGAWRYDLPSLEAEIRAYLVGGLSPRYPSYAQDEARLSDEEYLLLRCRDLGIEAVWGVIKSIHLLNNRRLSLISNCWPELQNALYVGRYLLQYPKELPDRWRDIDRIVVDELQDLTSVEWSVVALLAKNIAIYNSDQLPFLLVAGDEGQSVRSTDFDWPMFKSTILDILGHEVIEYRLMASQRCPIKIAKLIKASYKLYQAIDKDKRPRKQCQLEPDIDIYFGKGRLREFEQTSDLCSSEPDRDIYCDRKDYEQTSGQIYHLSVSSNDTQLSDLFALFKQNNAVLISLGHLPNCIPKDNLLTVEEVKGCEFQWVGVLQPSQHLKNIFSKNDQYSPEVALSKRYAIDHFRVALSRTTEILILLDIYTSKSELYNGAIDFWKEYVQSVTISELLDILQRSTEFYDVIADDINEYTQTAPISLEDRVFKHLDDSLQVQDTKPEQAWESAIQATKLSHQIWQENQDLSYSIDCAWHLLKLAFSYTARESSPIIDLSPMDLLKEAQTLLQTILSYYPERTIQKLVNIFDVLISFHKQKDEHYNILRQLWKINDLWDVNELPVNVQYALQQQWSFWEPIITQMAKDLSRACEVAISTNRWIRAIYTDKFAEDKSNFLKITALHTCWRERAWKIASTIFASLTQELRHRQTWFMFTNTQDITRWHEFISAMSEQDVHLINEMNRRLLESHQVLEAQRLRSSLIQEPLPQDLPFPEIITDPLLRSEPIEFALLEAISMSLSTDLTKENIA